MTRTFAPAPPTHADITAICRNTLGVTPSSVIEVRGGAWSSAVALETERGPMIMRFSKTSDDFRTDHLASRLASPNLPIPAVYGIGQLGDRWWCISQRMPGVHLDELSATELKTVLPSLAAVLRAMRDAPTVGTEGYGGWDENGNGRFRSFTDQLLDVAIDNPQERGGGWSDRLKALTHAWNTFDAGVRMLDSLCSFVPDTRQLIHQDTINFNITVNGDHITGIFDWGCAMWGDALYDLAWFRFWNPWYPQWESLHVPDVLEAMVGVEGDHARERMACYLLHIGVGHIRYNAFTENWKALDEVASATNTLIRKIA